MNLSWQPTRGRATGRVLAVFLAAALAGSGCDSHATPDPEGANGAASPGAGAQPHHSPQQVCTGFARTRFAHDTTSDPGPQAAHERAAAWAHPDHTQTPPPGRLPHWRMWLSHQVVVEVETSPWVGDGLPPDTGHTAHRAVVAAAAPVGADGWAGATEIHTVFCTVARHHDTWYVAAYHVDSGGGAP